MVHPGCLNMKAQRPLQAIRDKYHDAHQPSSKQEGSGLLESSAMNSHRGSAVQRLLHAMDCRNELSWCLGEFHGRIDHLDETRRGMLLLDYDGVVLDLRVSRDFCIVVDWGTQHVEHTEVIQPGVARLREKNRLQGSQ